MIITACGNGCFRIQTAGVTVLTEPLSGELSARFKPDIVLKTKYQLSPYGTKTDSFVVEGPGEYEVKGIRISGFVKNSYLLKSEEMSIAYITPSFSEKDLADAAGLEDADVLIISPTDEAVKIIKQASPKLVISATDDWQALAKAFDQKPSPQEKLTIKKKEIPATGPQMVVLTS